MNIKNLMRNIWDLRVLCRFAKTVFFLNLRSLHLLSLWAVAKPLRDICVFSFFPGLLYQKSADAEWKQRGTLLKCADVWWCIVRGNAVGTQELFVYFLQRNFDMGTQSCANNKAWQPLTDFRGPGRRRGRGEVNRQTPSHQSLQPGEAQEAKPADPLQGSDPSMPFS